MNEKNGAFVMVPPTIHGGPRFWPTVLITSALTSAIWLATIMILDSTQYVSKWQSSYIETRNYHFPIEAEALGKGNILITNPLYERATPNGMEFMINSKTTFFVSNRWTWYKTQYRTLSPPIVHGRNYAKRRFEGE